MSKRLSELMLDDNPEPGENDVQEREATITQMKEERATLNASKALLEELVAKSKQEIKREGPTINQQNQFGDNSSGAQVGVNHGGIQWTSGGAVAPTNAN